MAITIPIISEFSDKGLKSAEGAFNTFKTEVGKAEGAMGKFKAGAGVAMDYVNANAALMAATAGTAIAGFALKAIGDFQDLAISVDKFRDATGLTLDEASRWTEVAGDIDIDASTIQGAINRMNREASKGEDAFNKLGIEMGKHKDGTYDPQQTFLNTIEALKNMKDPADKARIATQLFGKGWTEIADLVSMGSDEILDRLKDVSEAKIINEEEVQKAKDLRDAQDKLNDALGDFALVVGQQLIPILTDLTDALTPVLEKSGSLIDILKLGFGTFRFGLWDSLGKVNAKLADGAIKAKDAEDALVDLEDSGQDLETQMYGLSDAWDYFLGRLDAEEAWINLDDKLKNAAETAQTALGENTPEAWAKADEARREAERGVAEYIEKLGTIPPEIQSKILTLIDQRKYDEVRRLLDDLAKSRTVQYIPIRPGDTPSETTGRGTRTRSAILGPTPEYIPNRIDLTGPASRYSGNVTVNVMGSVTSEKDLVETIRKGLVSSQRNGAQLVYSNV